jgi:hypothetical protein
MSSRRARCRRDSCSKRLRWRPEGRSVPARIRRCFNGPPLPRTGAGAMLPPCGRQRFPCFLWRVSCFVAVLGDPQIRLIALGVSAIPFGAWRSRGCLRADPASRPAGRVSRLAVPQSGRPPVVSGAGCDAVNFPHVLAAVRHTGHFVHQADSPGYHFLLKSPPKRSAAAGAEPGFFTTLSTIADTSGIKTGFAVVPAIRNWIPFSG